MSTERHFGPEIVESSLGATVVRDRKAATAVLVGTFPVDTVHTDSADQDAHINKSILIRRREEAVEHFGDHVDGYTIPAALDAIFDQDEGQGVGTIEVINVFDPATHTTGPGDVTPADIMGTFDASGNPSGLKHAYATFQNYGWFPKFLATPGFTGETGVMAELDVIAQKINARAYLDAPSGTTVQEAVNSRSSGGTFDWQIASERLAGCFPAMLVADGAGGTREDMYSARMLGIHLASIMTRGYHHSPSNRPIRGIVGAALPIQYTPGASDDDSQLLRDAGIVTAVERWGQGPHTAGNRSLAYPTSTTITNFIYVRLIADMLHEGILFYLDQYKDRLSSPARLNEIERRINEWGLDKSVGADPVLVPGGFRFWFDREQTTPQEYADGKVEFQMRFQPVGILEWMQVHSRIDISLAANAFGLASSSGPLFDPTA